jgi:hypothetical protein
VLVGPACPEAGAELAERTLAEMNIQPWRSDAIMGIELVFQPPPGADTHPFWTTCLEWSRTHYEHPLSAVIHRDQKHPHMHLIALAVSGGRLNGNGLSSGPNRFTLQRRAFMENMRDLLGLRPDRKCKTLADLAVSTGRGPKTRAEAVRRDAATLLASEATWARRATGMGVAGHGGPLSTTRNPHAHAEGPTPLLHSVSRLGVASALMAQIAIPQWANVLRPCPPPLNR